MTGEPPKKHVILFLAANPASTPRLALTEECSAIESELRLTADRDAFEFRSKWAVNIDEVMRHLNELQPTVIHFSGHGSAGATNQAGDALASRTHRDIATPSLGGLHFHGDSAHGQTVGAHALAQMIRTAAPSARLVVLNACFSDAVAEALRGTVECVVGMRGTIGDDAARAFSIGFYRALGYGRSIGNAVEQAKAGLAALQLPDHALPICLTRHDIDANRMALPNTSSRLPDAPPHPGVGEGLGRPFIAARKLLTALGDGRSAGTDEAVFGATLVHYNPVARAARDFKEVIHQRLIQWIEKHTFQTFVVDDDWQLKLAKYAPESDLYVSIAVRGRFENEKCKLEFGLWWQHDYDNQVSLYVGLHDVPWGKKVKPTKHDTRRDLTSTSYLLRDATTSVDPDSLLNELEIAARLARST